MPKPVSIDSDADSTVDIKGEATTPPATPSPKKGRKTTSTHSSPSSPMKMMGSNGFSGSLARTKKGLYMEMIFEAGLKAVNKQDVQIKVR